MEIPHAQRKNGKLTTQTLVAVDLSNVLHYPVQERRKMFLVTHARHLAQTCVDPVMRMEKSRGVTCFELHIDDPTRVPLPKCWEQRQRDKSRKDSSSNTSGTVIIENEEKKIVLDMNKKFLGTGISQC